MTLVGEYNASLSIYSAQHRGLFSLYKESILVKLQLFFWGVSDSIRCLLYADNLKTGAIAFIVANL